MSTELLAAAASRSQLVAAGKEAKPDTTAAALYLAFRLADEVYAIDILRIREILEYSMPTSVPMMPPSVRGVINLRGAVVPVIDLAVRFGREATGVGKRTCIVIVEAAHAGAIQILGLMVDGVNAVLEIGADSIEQPPAFGTRVNTEFIAGMARVNGRFVIILDIARVLSIDEMSAITVVAAGH